MLFRSTKTSDVGPVRAGITMDTLQQQVNKEVLKGMEGFDYSRAGVQYNKLMKGNAADQEQAKKIKEDYIADLRKTAAYNIISAGGVGAPAAPGSPIPLPSGGSNVPPPPAGFVPQ